MLRMYIIIHRTTMKNNTKNFNCFANKKIKYNLKKNLYNQKRQERRNQETKKRYHIIVDVNPTNIHIKC